jgi:hypothetical protein
MEADITQAPSAGPHICHHQGKTECLGKNRLADEFIQPEEKAVEEFKHARQKEQNQHGQDWPLD